MRPLRVLIVDDERPARTKVRRLLADAADIEVVGEADSGRAAVDAIRSHRPDVVFLDVQMPALDGFGVLAELDGEQLPQVVFVTAYDEYAVRAFEVHALDYLLKPVDPARFRAVLDRVRAHFEHGTQRGARGALSGGALEERVERLLQQLDRAPRFLERVLVTVNERSFFLKLDRVSWIESERNYVVFHAGQERYEVRGTLSALEQRLDPARWLRINRSQIVNIESIAQLEPWFHGEYRVLLSDGTRTTWSRRYLGRAEEILGKGF